MSSRRNDVAHPVGGPSRTRQDEKDLVDINRLVRKHAQSRTWEHVAAREPFYGDFSHSQRLDEALARVRAAETDFMRLPAPIRDAAKNSATLFYEMLATDEGVAKLERAGLPIDRRNAPSEPATASASGAGEGAPEEAASAAESSAGGSETTPSPA